MVQFLASAVAGGLADFGVEYLFKKFSQSTAKNAVVRTAKASAKKTKYLKKEKYNDVIDAEIIDEAPVPASYKKPYKKPVKTGEFYKFSAGLATSAITNSLIDEMFGPDMLEDKANDMSKPKVPEPISDFKYHKPNSIPDALVPVKDVLRKNSLPVNVTDLSNGRNLLDVIDAQTIALRSSMNDLRTEIAIIGEDLANTKNSLVPVGSSLPALSPSTAPVNVSFPVEFMETQKTLLDLKQKEFSIIEEAHTFDKTDLTIEDLEGNKVIRKSPREVRTMRDASDLKYKSDENNFKLDAEDLDFGLGGEFDFSPLFKPISSVKRFRNKE